MSCTNNKKLGKDGESEADRPSSKLHKSYKNGLNSPKLPLRDMPIICPSQFSSQPLSKRFILNFFQQIFLSRDSYDRETGCNLINGHPKLMSRRQFASVEEWAWCIASSTVGGSLGPFDHDKACQKILRAPGCLHNSNCRHRSIEHLCCDAY